MIIWPTGNRLLLVTQPDHGLVAGALARAWGNAAFAPAEPAAMEYVAEHHDDAWFALDDHPRLDAATARPHTFISLPPLDRIPHYKRGIDDLAAHDGYCGMLGSLHYVGLMNGFYGQYGPAPVRRSQTFQRSLLPAERQAVVRFKQSEAVRQRRLRPAGAGSAWEQRLWENYRHLQVWDTLSLVVCHHRFPGQTEQVRLPAAPSGPGAADLTVVATWLDEERLGLAPYPFAAPALDLSVAGRYIADRPYADQADLDAAYAAAELVTLHVRLEAQP